jgi:WD40 repeat protein
MLADLSNGTVRRLAGHELDIVAIAFSPDGRTLATSSSDNTLRLWDVGNGKGLRTLRTGGLIVLNLVFAGDGRTLAARTWMAILLFDVETGLARRVVHEPERTRAMALAPGGDLLALALDTGAVEIHQLDDHDEVPTRAEELRAWLARVSTAIVDQHDRVVSP